MTKLISELHIPFQNDIKVIWNDGVLAFSEMPKWEQGLHFFWLIGPFILLIERSPADLWLSFLALAFVVKSVLKREGFWFRPFWVKSCFLFLGICLLSSVNSKMSAYAISESVAWFRFPLFAIATVFWYGQDKRLLYLMLLSTATGMILMTGILTVEMILEGQKAGRLAWPYGDFVSGNYLIKVGLPAIVVMAALAVSSRPKDAMWMAGFSLITMVVSVLAGERINFLIRACGGMLAALAWKPVWRRLIILILAEVIAVFTVFSAIPEIKHRFTTRIIESLPHNPQSDYYQVMGAGIKVFETAPALGIGPATHRGLCPILLGDKKSFRCDNHPHNFYVQFLAETGIIGLFAGSLMIVSITWAAFAGWRYNRDNVVAGTAFVIPLGMFFPIASMGDFFGQWNNIFLWSSVALSLAAAKTLVPDPEKFRP